VSPTTQAPRGQQTAVVGPLLACRVAAAAAACRKPRNLARSMAAMNDERDKLGEALYMKVMKTEPELAGKITGMMLDSLEDSEILAVLDDEPVLREKIEQAVIVLNGSVPDKSQDNKAKDRQIKALQDELQEAETWAEDMQQEWDKKEAKFKKEKDALTIRVTAAEARAKATEKPPSNGADNAEAHAAKAEAEKKARKMQERVDELEVALDKAKKSAAQSEEKASVTDKSSADAVKRLKLELAAKEEKLQRSEKALEAAQKDAGGKANAAPAKGAEDSDLKSKLQKAEAFRDAEKLRREEADCRVSALEAELEAALGKKDVAKADRCRELQQDLENAHREIKSYKAQLKATSQNSQKDSQKETNQKDAPKDASRKKGSDTTGDAPKVDAVKKVVEKLPEKPAEKPTPKKLHAPVAEPLAEAEDEDEQEPASPPKAESKAVATAKSSKKGAKATPVAPASSSGSKKKERSAFQFTGAHVVAGCLAVVVIVQLGLFVYEGLVADGEQTWAQ